MLALLVGAALWAGCAPADESEPAAGATEVQRRLAAPEVGRYLVEAQQAVTYGFFDTALALTDSAARRAPRLADVPFLRARVYTRLGRLQEAEAAYERVLALDSTYQGAWMNLGNLAHRRQDAARAVACYRREYDVHASPDALLALGRGYVELGELARAREAYGRAAESESEETRAEAHAHLGQLYDIEGAPGAALEHAREALRLAPDDPNHRYLVGMLLLKLDRPDEAAGHLQRAAAARPWHYATHYNLGRALSRLGRTDEARRHLVRADTLEAAEREIVQLRDVAAAFPDRIEGWGRLAEAYGRLGRHEEALEAYQVALHLAPDNLYLQSNVAGRAAMAGRTAEAAARFTAILDENPDMPEVWLNLGLVYARSGQLEEARDAWRQAIRYDPDNRAARAYLARLEKP